MTDLTHQVPPEEEDYPLKAQVPPADSPQVPDRIWAFLNGPFVGLFVSGGIHDGGTEYLRATPPRLHAEELVEALEECMSWMTDTGSSEYKRAATLLAKIEEQKP